MAISLAKMAANSATVTLKIGEDTLNVVYAPALVTEKIFTLFGGILHAIDDAAALARFQDLNALIVSVVKSWDLFEDEAMEVVFPLDSARMDELPIMLRIQVLQAIKDDFRPEKIAA